MGRCIKTESSLLGCRDRAEVQGHQVQSFFGSHEMCKNEVELMLVNVLEATRLYIFKWFPNFILHRSMFPRKDRHCIESGKVDICSRFVLDLAKERILGISFL